jgi:hypothetical protein
MTWTSFHRRGQTLHDVIARADRRRDGRLPLDVPGVAETFDDEAALLGALQLRWHTRLAGQIERALLAEPLGLEDAVVAAWHAAADELPGVRAILDRERAEASTPAAAEAMAKATAKEHALLAMRAGRVSTPGPAAVGVGADIEERARATYRPRPATAEPAESPGSLFGRLRAVLAA